MFAVASTVRLAVEAGKRFQTMKAGVLDVQGNVAEHVEALAKTVGRARVARAKTPQSIKGLDALVIPGGESTTIGKLIEEYGLSDAIKEMASAGKPIMGTCAGMIVLAKGGGAEVNKTGQPLLGLMDVTVSRNAFGRQRESFEAELDVDGFSSPFPGIFIRAPAIAEVGEGVSVLSTFEDKVVMARQDNILALSFHPELAGDLRVHEYFISMIP